MEKPLNQFCRNDGINPSVDYSNPIMEKWVHKEVVKITGKGEDDFIIEQKPVKIDEVNIQKSIQEEAKTTDLKYLLKQLLATGDESVLNQRQGFYGDITKIQEVLEDKGSLVTPSEIKETLPEEFKDLTIEQLAMMSDSEIIAYVRSKKEPEIKPEEVKPEVEGN